MATTTCPKCGKPIRPGAKFCGNCGNTITDAPPAAAVPPPTPAVQTGGQPGMDACPHCGKPMRKGARFCSHCGKTIDQAVGGQSAQKPTTPSAAAAATPARAPLPPTQVSGGRAPAPAAPPAQAPPAAAPDAPKGKRYRILPWFAILAIIVVCGGLIAVSVFVFDVPGRFLGATETDTATPEPSSTFTTIPPTESPSIIEATPTDPPPPTETTAPTLAPTETEPAPVTPAPDQVIFLDNFETPLTDNWKILRRGQIPQIEEGFGAKYLDLRTDTNPYDPQIASNTVITSTPGVKIEFEAQLPPDKPNYFLVFDWAVSDDPRDRPSQANPGEVHFEIYPDKFLLLLPLTAYRCEGIDLGFNGTIPQRFAISFADGQFVNLSIGDQPFCEPANKGIADIPGLIFFGGNGWLSSVKVTSP